MSQLTVASVDALSAGDRIRAAYADQPGLRVTPAQIQRLLGAAPQETARALEQLVADGFLRRTSDGHFIRAATARVLPMPQAGLPGRWWWIRARHRRLRKQHETQRAGTS